MEMPYYKEVRRFNRLFSETEYAYHEAAVRLGLSDSAMRILYSLCCEGDPCPLQTVIRQSGASKQTINSAIRKLEREGMVRLEPSGPKSKDVFLTERGQELARKTAIPLIEMENEIYASWTKEELRTYAELSERFLAAFRGSVKRLEEELGKSEPGG